MGVAQSKNVANAVASVTNQVTVDTVGDIENIGDTSIQTVIKDSQIQLSGDLNIQNMAKNVYISHQIAKQMQTSQISNDISQKMLQEAMSSVGALGVGYASAENSASMFASASSIVKNALKATVTNFSEFTSSTIIDNSYIKAKNLNISNITSSNYVTDQTLDNNQVSEIDNKISQDISQKASAKIQGMTGLLLALALLIGVIAYALTKPLNTAAVKYIISAVLVVGLIILCVWLFVIGAPPLFTKPVIVSPYLPASQNGNCSDEIIDIKTRSIELKEPPLKYLYSIYTIDQDTLGCLLTLACAKAVTDKKSFNRGYNYITYDNLIDLENGLTGVRNDFGGDAFPKLPRIFTKRYKKDSDDTFYYVDSKDLIVGSFDETGVKQGHEDDDDDKENRIIIPNTEEFINYCQNEKQARYARFVLCRYLNIPNHYYINDDDPIVGLNNSARGGNGCKGVIGLAKNIDKKCKMKITRYNNFNPADRMSGGCTVEGEFGICNSGAYKVARQFKKWGMYLFIILIVGIILLIWLKNLKNKKNQENKKKNK